MLGEKIDENKTFEPPKEPVNKEKTPAFSDVHPIWLRVVDDDRITFSGYDGHLVLPILRGADLVN